MGTAPILKLIVSMSLPAMFSMLVQALYNIVDSMFVSMISNDALAAVSLAFPVQTLLIAVSVGTGVGINSLVSRRLGEGKHEEASDAATHGVLLGIASWLVFAILGICFTRVFFEAFTQNQNIIQMGCDYIYVVTIFSFGAFLQINIEKTLQATGNMIYPMLFQLVGAITNIILDPIFIFPLKMGVKGAAIATVIGQIVAMVFSLIVAFTKKHEVKISFKNFKLNWGIIRNIYAVGLPSIMMQSIMSVLTTLLNGILIGFSEAAVSVLGVYYKLQSFVFMPVFGMNQGIMPIMGYNFGARNKKRLMDAVKIGCIGAFGIMVVGMLLFWIFPSQLLGIFQADQQMLSIGVPAFRIISSSFLLAGFSIILSTLFQAVGMGGKSLLISIIRQLVGILPAAYLLSKVGLGYIWFSFPIAEVLAIVVSIVIFLHFYRTTYRNLAPSEL